MRVRLHFLTNQIPSYPSAITFTTTMIFAGLVSAVAARADVVIDTVLVGNTGNSHHVTGFGAVDYEYSAGRFEVTNSQYAEFLNSADPEAANTLQLYNGFMASSPSGGIRRNLTAPSGSRYELKTGRANNPVNFVSDHDAMRFANWLHNGQNGQTETGAYTLLGNSAVPTNLLTINRNSDATWALLSENEWYKAAYHQNDGGTSNYDRYPTQSDSAPHSIAPPGTSGPDATNSANVFRNDGANNSFNDGFATTGSTTFPLENALVDVGSYSQTTSAYGLFDAAGSVHEWTEAFNGSNRIIRGGSFWSATFGVDLDDATVRFANLPSGFEERDIGFRVARLATAVPEPSTILFLTGVAGAFARRRQRNRKVSDETEC